MQHGHRPLEDIPSMRSISCSSLLRPVKLGERRYSGSSHKLVGGGLLSAFRQLLLRCTKLTRTSAYRGWNQRRSIHHSYQTYSQGTATLRGCCRCHQRSLPSRHDISVYLWNLVFLDEATASQVIEYGLASLLSLVGSRATRSHWTPQLQVRLQTLPFVQRPSQAPGRHTDHQAFTVSA